MKEWSDRSGWPAPCRHRDWLLDDFALDDRSIDYHAQTLELVAQLLESAAETAANNPLNSHVAL